MKWLHQYALSILGSQFVIISSVKYMGMGGPCANWDHWLCCFLYWFGSQLNTNFEVCSYIVIHENRSGLDLILEVCLSTPEWTNNNSLEIYPFKQLFTFFKLQYMQPSIDCYKFRNKHQTILRGHCTIIIIFYTLTIVYWWVWL